MPIFYIHFFVFKLDGALDETRSQATSADILSSGSSVLENSNSLNIRSPLSLGFFMRV